MSSEGCGAKRETQPSKPRASSLCRLAPLAKGACGRKGGRRPQAAARKNCSVSCAARSHPRRRAALSATPPDHLRWLRAENAPLFPLITSHFLLNYFLLRLQEPAARNHPQAKARKSRSSCRPFAGCVRERIKPRLIAGRLLPSENPKTRKKAAPRRRDAASDRDSGPLSIASAGRSCRPRPCSCRYAASRRRRPRSAAWSP